MRLKPLNCPSSNRLTRFALILWSTIFWAFCLAPSGAVQAKRIALVIGNDQYRHVAPLEKAGNDAIAMGRELEAAGFDVRQYRDLDFKAMVRAVTGMVGSITGGDEVVIFFAGHGVQTRSGAYLLPTDIEATNEAEVERTSYSLEDLSTALSQAKPAFSLVIIDACRDNPLRSKTSSERAIGASRGLNPVDPPKGQIVIYSAGRGQQALDRLGNNDKNPNGVFTREFIARMKRPGMRIQDLVDEVGDAVEKLARTVNHDQTPAIYNQARGSFYFFAPTLAVNQPAPATAPLQTHPTHSGLSALQLEEKFWDATVLVGNDPAFQAYLKSYPQGRYADLARARLTPVAALGRAESPPSSVPAKDVKSLDQGWIRISGRFLGKGDEVLDQNTKLIWKRCPEGMRWTGEICEGTVQRYGWSRAVTRAQEISKAEGLPWTLPEADDLKALVERSAGAVKIDTKAFPSTPAYYFWSANPFVSSVIKSATAINFEDGIGSSLSDSSLMHVRLVRRQ
jgi:uncharacterized caspase-like protein